MTDIKDGVILAISSLRFVIDKDAAASLVDGGLLRLCGECPDYHLTITAKIALLIGDAVDLRKPSGDVTVTDDLAAKLATYGESK